MQKTIVTLLILSTNAMAFDLPSYATAKITGKLTTKQLSKVFNSSTPTCVKVGRSIVSANKAFKAINASKSVKKTICGDSAKAKAYHEALGVNVTVLRDSNLPTSILKKLIK